MPEARIIITIEDAIDRRDMEEDILLLLAKHNYRNITLTAGAEANQLVFEEVLAAGDLNVQQVMALADRESKTCQSS